MVSFRLMPDYQCYALWEGEGVENINPDDLPLSEGLVARIHAWEDAYDATLNIDDPARSGFSSTRESEEFDAEGMRLWKDLAAELGDGYSVRYFSISIMGFVEE